MAYFTSREHRFWKPSIMECLRESAVAAVLNTALFAAFWLTMVLLGYLPAWLMIPAVIVQVFACYSGASKRIIRERIEPFCIVCGYDLSGSMEVGRCPECAWRIDAADIDAYRSKGGRVGRTIRVDRCDGNNSLHI